jgi:membrane fusion protein, macrolide-specific efflux system
MKRTKKLTWMVIVLVIIAGITTFVVMKKKNGNGQYKSIPVTLGDLQVKVLSTGFVQPENRLEIKPQVSGRVEEVLVKEGQYVKKGQELAMVSSTERAALIDAARARGTEEQKKWEAYYKPMPILAPINGMIILRSIEPGQTFTTQDAVLVMSDRLTVKAQVDETDIAKVRLKQKAEIILDAYSDKVIPAYVDQIAYEAKTINNVTTYIVDVLPEKTPSYMLSGMTANVTFLIDTKTNVLLLPAEAIKNKGNNFYVFIKDTKSGPNPVEKQIETGATDGKNVEVVSGLVQDEVVFIPALKTADKTKGNNPFSPFKKKN